jgi:hypothetical protein
VSDAFVREMAAFDDEKTKLMATNLIRQKTNKIKNKIDLTRPLQSGFI